MGYTSLRRAVAHARQAGFHPGQPAELAIDLCDLTVAYLKAGRLDEARQASTEMLSLHDATPEAMMYPQFILWASAQTAHALGENDRALELQTRAHETLQRQAEAIADEQSRAAFLRLPFNRELISAAQGGSWPLNSK